MTLINPDMIQIRISNGETTQVKHGTTLGMLAEKYRSQYASDIVAAKVNNDIRELSYKLEDDADIEFIDLSFDDGMRIYRRGLVFLLITAVYEMFPESKLSVCHSVGNGFFCEIKNIDQAVNQALLDRVEAKMRELVEEQRPFVKKIMPIEDAREMFVQNGMQDKFRVFEYRRKPYVTVYSCGEVVNYFYGYMPPHTGYIKTFEIRAYADGLILRFPHKDTPDKLDDYTELKKLFNVFAEHKRWIRILEMEDVGALNDAIAAGRSGELVRISEALHEKKIAQIADMVVNSDHKKRLVLISGPSSSGKTTFANRLCIQLRVNGVKPVIISLDNYFVNREFTPRLASGEYDFESLEAIDLKLFNEQLAALIRGEQVELPIFNFKTGTREREGIPMQLEEDQVLVIEGIHGLNERLTESVNKDWKFKIYISPMTTINIDDHNRIPSTDLRILRRMVRDVQFRSASPVNTIRYWPVVRRGEEKNIYPFQEQADVMFNSSLPYELAVIKKVAEPHLEMIDRSQKEYSEARRLLEFLSYVLPVGSEDIPHNSIMREFVGGTCFKL